MIFNTGVVVEKSKLDLRALGHTGFAKDNDDYL
jgi:hypothetical protein